MKLQGTYTIDAPRERVFDTLMSTDAIRACLPGCERFEHTGGGRYETSLTARLAGVRGTFTGAITLQDPKPPESYTLLMEGAFSGGRVSGAGYITLLEDGPKTRGSHRGDAPVSGPRASVGQRLMHPAAKMVVGQFFKCMQTQMNTQPTTP